MGAAGDGAEAKLMGHVKEPMGSEYQKVRREREARTGAGEVLQMLILEMFFQEASTFLQETPFPINLLLRGASVWDPCVIASGNLQPLPVSSSSSSQPKSFQVRNQRLIDNEALDASREVARHYQVFWCSL